MRLILGHDAEIAAWVAARIPHVGTADAFGPCTTLGLANDTGLVGGAVYHNYMPSYQHCEISFASSSPRFATRGSIRAVLSVPFEQYDCRTVSLMIPHLAERTKRWCAGIGFKRRGCLPEFFAPGLHGEIYTMTRKDYSALRRRIG